MDSIITRQQVARRRRPAASSSRKPAAGAIPARLVFPGAGNKARGLPSGPWFLESSVVGAAPPNGSIRRRSQPRHERRSFSLGALSLPRLTLPELRLPKLTLPSLDFSPIVPRLGKAFSSLIRAARRQLRVLRDLPSRLRAFAFAPRAPGHQPQSVQALPSEEVLYAEARGNPRLDSRVRARGMASPRGSLPRAQAALALGGALALLTLGCALVLPSLLAPDFPLPAGGFLPESGDADEVLLSYLFPEFGDKAPETELPPLPRTLETSGYTVKPGDSLGSVARRFGLSLDSLISMNGISSAKNLRSGTELRIPNMDGLLHRVAAGESLGSLAKRYGSSVTALADANDLGTATIRPGQVVFIPGASLPPSELKKVLGDFMAWPLRGPISSWYGYRQNPFTGIRQFHAGLDIVVSPGTPVRAIMEGRVAEAGYSGVFGNYVILSHGDGYQSLYGHLSSIAVKRGQSLGQGSLLGASGNTGYSTGPHLHLGLYRRGVAVNPTKFLK